MYIFRTFSGKQGHPDNSSTEDSGQFECEFVEDELVNVVLSLQGSEAINDTLLVKSDNLTKQSSENTSFTSPRDATHLTALDIENSNEDMHTAQPPSLRSSAKIGEVQADSLNLVSLCGDMASLCGLSSRDSVLVLDPGYEGITRAVRECEDPCTTTETSLMTPPTVEALGAVKVSLEKKPFLNTREKKLNKQQKKQMKALARKEQATMKSSYCSHDTEPTARYEVGVGVRDFGTLGI